MNVTLTIVPGDPSNPTAWRIVEAIPGVNADVCYVGEFFAKRFPVPFLRTECGLICRGMDGIEWFSESMRRHRNDAVRDRTDANLREVFA